MAGRLPNILIKLTSQYKQVAAATMPCRRQLRYKPYFSSSRSQISLIVG